MYAAGGTAGDLRWFTPCPANSHRLISLRGSTGIPDASAPGSYELDPLKPVVDLILLWAPMDNPPPLASNVLANGSWTCQHGVPYMLRKEPGTDNVQCLTGKLHHCEIGWSGMG